MQQKFDLKENERLKDIKCLNLQHSANNIII